MENPFKKIELIEETFVRINSYKGVRSVADGLELLEDDERVAEFSEAEARALHEILGHYLATVDGVEEPQPNRPFLVGDRVILVEGFPEDPPTGCVGTVIHVSTDSLTARWDSWNDGWSDDGGHTNCWAVDKSFVRHYS